MPTSSFKGVTKAALVGIVEQAAASMDLFQERIAELELALEDREWQRMTLEGDREFSRPALQKIADLAALFYLKNPLVNRAVEVQRHYVFGRGISIVAKDPEVNRVCQGFMDDPANRAELTSQQQLGLKEVDLQTDGNVFLVLFTDPQTGRVRVRSFPFGEIEDVVCDPEDRRCPWYYKRAWTARTFDRASGEYVVEQRVAYYPDWRYRETLPSTIATKPVVADARVMHVKVGMLSRMKFGVPEVYAAIDWARAVTTDLERYATMKLALARFALSLTVKGGAAARTAARKKLETTVGVDPTRLESNPPPVAGSTFIATEGGSKLDVIRTAGAQPSPDEGRRLWLMVCAATGLPETILTGDSDVGNYATAKTLDRPTELKMADRQRLWAEVFANLLDYAMKASVRAPAGVLAGKATIGTDPITGEEVLDWPDDSDATVSVTFPDILEHDPEATIKGIVSAATLDGNQPARTIPDRVLSRLFMQALNVEDMDEVLEEMYPDGAEGPPFGTIGAPQPVQLAPDGTPLQRQPPGAEPPTGRFPPPAPAVPLRNSEAEAERLLADLRALVAPIAARVRVDANGR